MRLFVAAELPEGLVEELSETSALLRDAVRGRFVAPDSFHVTLAFLGEVSGSRVPELVEVLNRACFGCRPIDVALGSLGSFGRPRKATLWQAVESDGKLERLAASVRTGLSGSGFSFDDKGFLAHVTLMRAADVAAGELPMPHVTSGTIREVTLFRSDLSGDRPVYIPLHTCELVEGAMG